jgi:hypothetical protein
MGVPSGARPLHNPMEPVGPLLGLEIEKHQFSRVAADRHQKAAIGRPAWTEDALGPGQDRNLVRLQIQNFDILVFRERQTSKGDTLTIGRPGGIHLAAALRK